MKVVAVLGSPHADGPSSTIAKEVLRGAREAGHEVVVYNISEMNVKGCMACGYCKKNYCDCIQNDDLKPYWKDLHEAGALIVAAPNYCSQICGPMITYMNRHYCLVSGLPGKPPVRVHPGIKLIGVFSQGYDKADAYLDTYKWYLGDFENRDMVLQDILIHAGNAPYDAGSEIMQRAYTLGKNL
ncbi:MAG: flavodoxin family protein [Firmicutes bacterium]|nr:flavodoxin family protein [Bacillota bacterium]